LSLSGEEPGSGLIEVATGDTQLSPATSADVLEDRAEQHSAAEDEDASGDAEAEEQDEGSGEDTNDAPFPLAAGMAAMAGAAVLARTRQEK